MSTQSRRRSAPRRASTIASWLPTRRAPIVLALLMAMAAIGMPVARLHHSATHAPSAATQATTDPVCATADRDHDEASCLICHYLATRHDAAALDHAGTATPALRLLGITASIPATVSRSILLETKEARGPPLSC
jgi:hypothetical protein